MNKTVELVNEWAAFETNYPGGSIEDFCRYFLITEREKQNQEIEPGIPQPPHPDMALSKIMGKIMRIFSVYAEEAIKVTGLKKLEDFSFLNYISHTGNPKKTEVIYANISELSTGLSVLEQLKKWEFIIEKDDPEDKRSKRVTITPKGKAVLLLCYEQFGKVGEILFGEMALEDIELCIQLLQPIDVKHMGLWQQYKGKPFQETYEQLTKNLPQERKKRC